MNDGKRWWIVTVFWQAEGPDNPLPEKYLTKGEAAARSFAAYEAGEFQND